MSIEVIYYKRIAKKETTKTKKENIFVYIFAHKTFLIYSVYICPPDISCNMKEGKKKQEAHKIND